MRTRLLASVAALAAFAAVPAGAAMRPVSQVVDPKGDARGNLGFADIVSVRWSTAGKGDARALVATMTLAGAPRTDAGFVYEAGADVDGCGHVQFTYAPLSAEAAYRGPKSFYAFCGGPTETSGTTSRQGEVSVDISGRSITWSVPFAVLPPTIGLGRVYSSFDATADVAEPVVGTPVLGIPGQSIDQGQGNVTWRPR